MLHLVYISSFEELGTEQLPEIDYKIEYCSQQIQKEQSQLATIQSENCILLYSACIEFYGKISKQNAQQITNYCKLSLISDKIMRLPASLQYLLNYADYSHLDWIKQDWEAELLIKYIKEDINQNAVFSLNMNGTQKAELFCILKFKEDISESEFDISSNLSSTSGISNMVLNNLSGPIQTEGFEKKERCAYFVVYDSKNPITEALIKNFRIKILNEKFLTQKLELIDMNHLYNNKDIISTFYKYEEWQQSGRLLIYGNKIESQKLMKTFQKKLYSIKHKQFERGSPIINNIHATMYRSLYEKLGLTKIFANQTQINVFYYKEVQELFQPSFANNLDVKELKYTQLVKNLFKQDQELDDLKSNNPQLIRVKKKQNDYLIGKKQVIDKIQQLAIQKAQINSQKQSQKNKISQSHTQKNIYTLETLHNIEITRYNYQKVFQCCNSIKIERVMPFKIDLTIPYSEIRILNTAKNYKIIYLIFDSYSQIIQLQSIIQDKISLWKIEKAIKNFNNSFIARLETIKTDNELASVVLIPGRFADLGGEGSIDQLVKQYGDEVSHNKIILCNLQTLKFILEHRIKELGKVVNFAVDYQEPMFQDLSLLMESKEILKKNDISIKAESANKNFRNTFEKDLIKIRQIMQKCSKQYCIGDYILTQVDNYNVAYMISHEIRSLFFILTKNQGNQGKKSHDEYSDKKKSPWIKKKRQQYPVNSQFIYFTYHQKLMKVKRDSRGRFQTLENATMWELGAIHEQQLKSCFRKAFMVGQKYISIRIPYEHIKQSTSKEIKLINKSLISNRNLLAFYSLKINESNVYRAQIFTQKNKNGLNKHRMLQNNQTIENPGDIFAKRIMLKFDDPIIKEIIKKLNFGYGNIKKKKQGLFYCIEGDYQICSKLLDKFSEHYIETDKTKEQSETQKKKEAQKKNVIQVNGYISK